jgi:hypothetical protein
MLITADFNILSATGVQQGDPLGPLLFALAIDNIARSVESPFNVWYLDDATIGGPVESIINDLTKIVPALTSLGLEVNPSKSEVINIDYDFSGFEASMDQIRPILSELRLTAKEDAQILGSPLLDKAVRECLSSKQEALEKLTTRLQTIDAHPALFLLKNCFALPKLLYVFRSAPCYTHVDLLSQIDAVIQASAEKICNVRFDGIGWDQAKLPLRFGGIGLRSATDIAIPAFASSAAACRQLINGILIHTPESNVEEQVRQVWLDSGLLVPIGDCRQQEWDNIGCTALSQALTPRLDQHRLACFSSASQRHSGAWLNALPSSSTGGLLDDDCLRVGVALRLGLQVCERHRCRCGAVVDESALHPLSCRLSAGRIPRHTALNDIVLRALGAAGFPAVLEPVGLDRGDGKRPDGITTFPYAHGRALIWDATCTDTFAASNLITSANNPASAASRAEKRKIHKYRALSDRYIFSPVSVETSGVLGPETISFLSCLGSKAAKRSGDKCETTWLYQRISLAILRGNCFSIVSAGGQRR